MKKLLKFLGIISLVILFIANSVFAYTKITTDISASTNSEVSDTLTTDVNTTSTTFTVNSTSIQAGKALIGNEVVDVTAGGGTSSLTVTRAQNGTAAAAHSEGDTIRQLTQNVDVIFTPEAYTDYNVGDKVIVYIPNISPNSFGDMSGVTATITESGAADFGAASYNADARTITFTVITAGTSSQAIIAISELVMPDAPGQYLLPVEIRSNSDSLIEMGVAPLSWANQVRIRAIIQPALVFTVDNTNVDITANPSINDGENYDRKSILSVSTNALEGYNISAKLEGKYDTTIASLQTDTDNDNTKDYEIISDDAMTDENVFGYIAYNGNGDAFEQSTDVTGRANMNDTVTRTRTELKSDTSEVVAFDNSDTVLLPVRDQGSNDTPGDSSTELAFDSFINIAKHTVYYALNIDYLLPTGEYEGLITYTATPSF